MATKINPQGLPGRLANNRISKDEAAILQEGALQAVSVTYDQAVDGNLSQGTAFGGGVVLPPRTLLTNATLYLENGTGNSEFSAAVGGTSITSAYDDSNTPKTSNPTFSGGPDSYAFYLPDGGEVGVYLGSGGGPDPVVSGEKVTVIFEYVVLSP